MSSETIIEFKCNIDREVFSSDNYKIYGVNIDTDVYPNVKLNQYNNVTIVGDVHSLTENVEYTVKGREVTSSYGDQYEVINISRDKPSSKEETHKFLREVISEKQADVLIEVYPDIVDRIINKNLDDIDLNLTKGIKDATFNNIKKKVTDNFALLEVTEKYGGYGLSMNVLKKLYEEYTSTESLERALKDNPYKSLCKISGISFKSADNIILSMPNHVIGVDYNIKTSRQRMLSAMHFILEENEKEGHTKMSIEEFTDKCVELTPECTEYFAEIIKEDTHFYFNPQDRIIASHYAYKTEEYISDKIKLMLKSSIKYDIDYTVYQNDGDITLTEQQMGVLKNLCEYNVSLLAGFSGSGKTSSVKAVINMLKANGLKSVLMSPTGQASKVLSDSSGKEASTIHRGLGYNPSIKDKWLYNENNQLEYDVVIVDETGMVDVYLLSRLLKAINPNKTKILMIQDPAQIPSVSSGNCSDDMIKSLKIPTTMLTQIFRYGEGGLYNVATKVRNGEYYIPKTSDGVINFGDNKDYSIIDMEQEDIIDGVVTLYGNLLSQGNKTSDILVLSHHNKGAHGTILLNERIQSSINPITKNKPFIKSGNSTFILGDRVLQVVNNYKAIDEDGEESEIFNGNTGVINYIDLMQDSITVKFDDRTIVYKKDDLNQLQLGYAISIHKSQGSGSKNVIVITPRAHTYFLNRNLIYTAITRTRERCFHFTSKDTVRSAIKKSIPHERKTFLKELLKHSK